MSGLVSALADRVVALSASVAPARVMIGLVGEPGAGKSTVAAALRDALAKRGIPTALVPMDGFHLANVELARLGRADRKGALDTFDGAGYAALLARLRARPDEVVYGPVYDRNIEESVGSAIPVGPGIEVVLTEGNYLLVDEPPWTEVAGLLDEVWFVDVEPDLRRDRLRARHVEFGKAPEIAAAWVENVDEPNAARIRSTAARADLVVST